MDPTPDAAPDQYLNASEVLPQGDKFSLGKVIGSKHDSDGNPIVRAHEKPFLDTRQYEFEFVDGEITELTSNVIVESMYAQVDSWGK